MLTLKCIFSAKDTQTLQIFYTLKKWILFWMISDWCQFSPPKKFGNFSWQKSAPKRTRGGKCSPSCQLGLRLPIFLQANLKAAYKDIWILPFVSNWFIPGAPSSYSYIVISHGWFSYSHMTPVHNVWCIKFHRRIDQNQGFEDVEWKFISLYSIFT